MSNIKFKASKKTTIILLVVLFLIIGGTGGYLLWRVNQQKTVAPTDSSAEGSGGQNGKDCCCDVLRNECSGVSVCEYERNCLKSGICLPKGECKGSDESCVKDEDCCTKWVKILKEGQLKCTCTMEEGCCTGVPQCSSPRRPDCPYNCVWPFVSWYFEDRGCECAPCSYDERGQGPYCQDNAPTCNPAECPAGYQEHEYNWNCEAMMEHGGREALDAFLQANGVPRPSLCGDGNNDKICVTECRAKCAGCNNEYVAYRYCVKKEEPPANTCDGGTVREEPIILTPSTPDNCAPIRFDAMTWDADGVGQITVKLGSKVLVREDYEYYEEKDYDNNRKGVVGKIKGSFNCGTTEQVLTISWVDAKGASGDRCSKEIRYTPKSPVREACDGVGKDSKITITHKSDGNVEYRYKMGASKGIDLNSVTVLVNHAPFGVEKKLTPSSGTPTTATVEGTLDEDNYKVGNNHMLIAWKIPGEAQISEFCQIRGEFEIEGETYDWGIEKSVVEECVDGPLAKLSYKITITNKGATTGTITSVVDKLDSKVVEGSVTDISDGGVYTHSDRTVRWGSFQIPAGQSKVLSYSITVTEDAFGTYDNVVTAKTEEGAELVDNATVIADCDIPVPPKEGGTVPDTGLFDESENIVVIGGILLFLGLGWTWLTKTYQIVNGKLVERSKERFEQRVVKK